MEVHLTPDLQAKLDRLVTETGRSAGEFVQDAMAGYVDELAEVRATLDGRYDDLKSGRVKPIGGDEVIARLQAKTGYEFHPEAAIDLDEIWEFIAADNLDAADGVITDILSAIDVLVPFPHQGYRRSDLTSRPLRFTQAGGYLIAYAPDEKPLWILAVIHGRRSPRVMAAILRGRQ